MRLTMSPPFANQTIENVNQELARSADKSFAGLFKGRGVQGQSPCSRPAGHEIPKEGRAAKFTVNHPSGAAFSVFAAGGGKQPPQPLICIENIPHFSNGVNSPGEKFSPGLVRLYSAVPAHKG
nr:hypothetical protein [uncultured Oscillibacter sp.]